MAKVVTDRQIHKHTQRHSKYRNPHCACVMRVNKVLKAWSNHFRYHHEEEFPDINTFKSLIDDLSRQTWENDSVEMILDVPFMLEEVEGAVGGGG